MRQAYLLLGWGVILFGAAHMWAAVQGFDAVTADAVWFFSGGMLLALVGAVNLVNRAYGRIAPGLRWLSLGMNVIMSVFGVVAGWATGSSATGYVVVLGLLWGVTLLSFSSHSLVAMGVSSGETGER